LYSDVLSPFDGTPTRSWSDAQPLNKRRLQSPGQTGKRVEKREFARDFSQLSCPDQTRTRGADSWWELTEY
jgi:hypothetical protein